VLGCGTRLFGVGHVASLDLVYCGDIDIQG
jgi:hypothetical protein